MDPNENNFEYSLESQQQIDNEQDLQPLNRAAGEEQQAEGSSSNSKQAEAQATDK